MRGKQAAKAANRRVASASEEVAQLKEKWAAEREAWREERNALNAELAAARLDIEKQVGRKVNAEIARVRDNAAQRAAAADARAREAALKAVEYISDNGEFTLHARGMAVLAEMCGVSFGDFIDVSGDQPRRVRRATSKDAKRMDGIGHMAVPGCCYDHIGTLEKLRGTE